MGRNEWNQLYKTATTEKLPWFSVTLDKDIASALKKFTPITKTVLSIGEGPGTQAIALAQKGFHVTATDISRAAVEQAQVRARQGGATVEFRIDDIVHSKITKTFGFIVDRGCFHTLDPKDRTAYVRNIRRLLEPSGMVFLKCFSEKETMEGGPNRFSEQELREQFQKNFEVLSLTETEFEGTKIPFPKALFLVLKKKD